MSIFDFHISCEYFLLLLFFFEIELKIENRHRKQTYMSVFEIV
jgi:hypothetical protein